MAKLALPQNIGTTLLVEREDGSNRYYTIVDEIVLLKPGNSMRALCFQKLQSKKGGLVRFRFSYYYAADDGWVLAQIAPYLVDQDFQQLVTKAVKKGWIQLGL